VAGRVLAYAIFLLCFVLHMLVGDSISFVGVPMLFFPLGIKREERVPIEKS